MTDLKAFIIESIKRIKQPGSTYYKYWSKINTVLIAVAGLPQLLQGIDNIFEIKTFDPVLPHQYWIRMFLKIALGAATYAKIIGGFSVYSNHEIVKDGNVLIQQPCADLPFTNKKDGVKLVDPKEVNTLSNQ